MNKEHDRCSSTLYNADTIKAIIKANMDKLARCVFHVWKFGQRKAQFQVEGRSGLHLKKKFGFGRWIEICGQNLVRRRFIKISPHVCPEEVKLHCMTVLVNQLFRKCSNIICSTNYDIDKNNNILLLKTIKVTSLSKRIARARSFTYLKINRHQCASETCLLRVG